jgi:hypothetical protein
MTTSLSRVSAVLGLVLAGPAAAQPFAKSGGEFRVNTMTTGYQGRAAVGMDVTGAFLVAWASLPTGLRAQRYAPTGAGLGGELAVSPSTTLFPISTVVGQATGQFVVVWERYDFVSPATIMAQRIQGGALTGTAFRVDVGATSGDQRPAVAPTASGDFAVVWGRSPFASDHWDLFGQRLSASGTLLGFLFHISTTTTNQNSGAPAIARRYDGAFVVVWTPNTYLAAVHTVFGRPYDAAGVAGSTFVVNDPSSPANGTPGAAFDANGNYVVVWGGSSGVWSKRYDASGIALGDLFRVDTSTNNPPLATLVASDPAGNFVVVWGNGDVSTGTIYGRRFTNTGAPTGDPFRVNTETSAKPRLGGMAMDAAGNFVVVWQRGIYPTGDIFAQRFCATLAGDANGDGTLDIGDVFYVINNLFAGGPAPVKNSDVNADGTLDIGDVFFVINYLFAGGPAPACA